MKKKILLIIGLSLLISACNNSNKKDQNSSNNRNKNLYTLTIDGYSSISIYENDNILNSISNLPTKSGYSLTGWTIDGVVISKDSVYTYGSDKTIVPIFTPNSYILTFNGSTQTTKEVIFDQPIGDLPDLQSPEGYQSYWAIDNLEISEDTIWTYPQNMNALTKNRILKYNLFFEGIVGSTLEVFYGLPIGELPTINPPSDDYIGVWKIDDLKIDENTIWGFECDKTAVISYIKIKDGFSTIPSNGAEVSINNDAVNDLYSNYSYGYSEKYRVNQKDQYANIPLSIKWESDTDYAFYRFKIGMQSDLNDAETYIVFNKSFSLKNAYTNQTYYYQILAYDEQENLLVTSMIRSVFVKPGPRTIDLNGVSNIRDIGGNVTTFKNKKIKQGMIYRSAKVDALNPSKNPAESKYFLNNLKIKTDFDLRNSTETGGITSSPTGCQNYVHYSGVYYTSGEFGIDTGVNTINLGKEMKIFANRDYYPIDFHCAIGRDRTGCLNGILLGLLGVSYEDICKDYEMSFLSEAATSDNTSANIVKTHFKSFMDFAIRNGGNKNTLSEQIEYFLLNYCGMTQQQIDNIKSIMLEDK